MPRLSQTQILIITDEQSVFPRNRKEIGNARPFPSCKPLFQSEAT